MNEYLVIIIFIVWYVFSLYVSETMGKTKKIGVQWSFFACIMLTPVVGYIITKISPKALQTIK